MHPQFNTQNYQNDIAILRTTTDIIFTATVSPICLPFRYSDRSFAGINVIGLGKFNYVFLHVCFKYTLPKDGAQRILPDLDQMFFRKLI